jgi:hypothetical protein
VFDRDIRRASHAVHAKRLVPKLLLNRAFLAPAVCLGTNVSGAS